MSRPLLGLLDFVGRWLAVPGVGNTTVNRGQCVGLVEVWLDNLGHPHVWGNALSLLDAAGSSYTRILNTPSNYPEPGDVVVWDGVWGGGYGHCAVVLAANTVAIVVFEQHDPGPPTVATHDYSHVLGWLHPR